MARPALLAGVVVVGLGAVGCASYRAADLPWASAPQPGEFAVRSDMRQGDRVRVTATGGEVTEGLLLECDAAGVTVATTGADARLVLLAPEEVRAIEVNDAPSQRGLATAGIVVVSAALTALILDEILEDDPEPDFHPARALAP